MAQDISDTVLVAVDGSENADKAFKWYLDYLHKPNNKILLCHVQEPSMHPAFGFRAGLAVTEDQWKTVVEEHKKKESELLTKYTKPLQDSKIEYTIKQTEGEAGSRLCQVAQECQVSYIVTGSRGMGKVRRTILGSVSDYILHHAHCPVLICRQ